MENRIYDAYRNENWVKDAVRNEINFQIVCCVPIKVGDKERHWGDVRDEMNIVNSNINFLLNYVCHYKKRENFSRQRQKKTLNIVLVLVLWNAQNKTIKPLGKKWILEWVKSFTFVRYFNVGDVFFWASMMMMVRGRHSSKVGEKWNLNIKFMQIESREKLTSFSSSTTSSVEIFCWAFLHSSLSQAGDLKTIAEIHKHLWENFKLKCRINSTHAPLSIQ